MQSGMRVPMYFLTGRVIEEIKLLRAVLFNIFCASLARWARHPFLDANEFWMEWIKPVTLHSLTCLNTKQQQWRTKYIYINNSLWSQGEYYNWAGILVTICSQFPTWLFHSKQYKMVFSFPFSRTKHQRSGKRIDILIPGGTGSCLVPSLELEYFAPKI
jgi:hypothetical protein